MEGEYPLRDEWQLHFASDSGYQLIHGKALSAELRHSRLRSVAWLVFLGVVEGPPTAWPVTLATLRARYAALRDKHFIDPKTLPAEEEGDTRINHPLSRATESPWARYFKNKELERSIMQDILRTHPESPFFQSEWVRAVMLNCLFLFAKENGETCYRQGMHELLAVLLFLLDQERRTPEELAASSLAGNEAACAVLDRSHFEADAFALFAALMQHANPWFEVVDTSRAHLNVAKDGAFIADRKQAEEEAIQQAPIVSKCRNIQHVLLKKHDLPLYTYLKTLNIEPQLYALRWVRLMFGREFHFHDVLTLWDAILAWGNRLVLVDYISVTMLMYIREAILGKEYVDAMARLMKFPPVEDVAVFVESALQMVRNKAVAAGAHPLAVNVPPVERYSASLSSAPAPNKGRPAARATRSASPAAAATSSTAAAESASAVAAAYAAAEDTRLLMNLRESNEIIARRLNSVVLSLQQQLLSDESHIPDVDAALVCLAELKQMKDILSGALEPSDAHLLFGERLNPAPVVADAAEPEPEATPAIAAAPAVVAVAAPAPAVVSAPQSVSWGDEEEGGVSLTAKSASSSSTSWLDPLLGWGGSKK